MIQPENIQTMGKEGFEVAMRSLGAITTGAQAAAVEATDYAKRSLEQGSRAAERLMSVRSLDSLIQAQGELVRTAYEGFVSQATRMGEIAANTAKAAYAPVESMVANPARKG